MSSSNKKCRGGVFVELILALPVIILIPFSVLEISRLLEKIQIVNVVGQEIAATADRQCSDFSDKRLEPNFRTSYVKKQDHLIDQTNTCLTDQVLNSFNNVDAAVVGDFRIAISVFRYYTATDGGQDSLYRIGARSSPSTFTSLTVGCAALTGLDTGNCGSDGTIQELSGSHAVYVTNQSVKARERIVVVEIDYRINAIAPFVKILREIGGDQHAYREITIL